MVLEKFKLGEFLLKHKFLTFVVIALASIGLQISSASASVVARIDISRQLMEVFVNGVHYYSWPVSTARRGYHTPRGRYRPTVLRRMHYSSKYNNSPMPYSIFFKGGYAIHGTNYVSRLGRPASHGCIRLRKSSARTLYNLAREHRGRVRIIIRN